MKLTVSKPKSPLKRYEAYDIHSSQYSKAYSQHEE